MSEESPPRLMKGGALHMSLDEGEDAYKVADSAYDEMLSRGIKLPERPKPKTSHFIDADGGPLVPPNLQDLSNHQLGELYGILDDYYAYITGQLADIQNQLEQAKEAFEFISSKVRLAKEGKQKDKDDLKKSDRRYVTANAMRLELKCLYNLLSKVVLAVEGKLKLVSRNITLSENALKTGTRRAAVDVRRQLSEDPHVPQRHRKQLDSNPPPTQSGEAQSVRLTRARPVSKKVTPRKRPRRPPPRGRRR